MNEYNSTAFGGSTLESSDLCSHLGSLTQGLLCEAKTIGSQILFSNF